MKLLDPNAIREDKSESTEQARVRSNKLAAEESRLAKQINIARENANKEISDIEIGVKETRRKADHEKSIIESEIGRLKEQKKELMRPIEDIKAEADRVLKEAENNRAESEHEKKDLEKDRKTVQDEKEANDKRSKELDIRENQISERDKNTTNKENQLKASSDELAKSWENYHKAVAKNDERSKELDNRENDLNIVAKTQDTREEEINKREQKIEEDKRLIRSNYSALEKAKEHLGIK